jgi:hypothetical protein
MGVSRCLSWLAESQLSFKYNMDIYVVNSCLNRGTYCNLDFVKLSWLSTNQDKHVLIPIEDLRLDIDEISYEIEMLFSSLAMCSQKLWIAS